MPGSNARRQPRNARVALIGGIALLSVAFAAGSLWLGLVGVVVLGVSGWTIYTTRPPPELEPWVWPPDLRAAGETLSRLIDPAPRRLLPFNSEGPEIAQVASTKKDLQRLRTEKLPLWPLTLFTSVLVQRRNAVQPRLRECASGYQPAPGTPLDGQRYAQLAREAMLEMTDRAQQMEQFMLSPAFTGALNSSELDADADSIVRIADRLMDYHKHFLRTAERCLQTPVEADAIVFAQDAGALAMFPLIGYDKFIITMCDRMTEGRDLLPYALGKIELDRVTLSVEPPDEVGDELLDRFLRNLRRFDP